MKHTPDARQDGYKPMDTLQGNGTGHHQDTTDGQSQSLPGRVVWYLTGLVLVLLAFRFLLPLFGANLDTGFSSFIFTVTTPLVVPFSGLFSNIIVRQMFEVEPNTLVAMAVYALIGWGLVKLLTIRR